MKRTSGDAAAADPGSLLYSLLREERLEGFEKSFKMTDGTLLAERYLLGIPRSRIRPQKLYEVCERLAMPESLLAALKEGLPNASTVHFGFEGNARGGVYKVYLEFAGPFYRALAADPGSRIDPLLLHLAYKWDASDSEKSTVARYVCHPRLSRADILRRLEGIYSGHRDRGVFAAVAGIVELAAQRTAEPLMYLEVSEAGNPRSSFDINVHEAGLRLRDIGHWLDAMRAHYGIAPGQFERMYAQIGAEKFGHLSGGISREGGDFLTVYYEAESR